ncbi:MAG: hypothetical protein GWN01_14120 [Nitrosopumilaceae archaeon]|nr:hypothetical protein [Nitrosopumilaceae archaeon]NIU01994.1 hypothetical protein [Nitrosopumilaceae archaeon]NIU87145.1 hypothetical protein [Nitrosopumilaceae archaeon]NIV64635.1 hypothetical protein [Nitrosopumilaceae archaeon]NIX62595.1 hypothetical protein [Nitrosopumilaceae archaeon]
MTIFSFNTIDEFKAHLEKEISKNNHELDYISKAAGERIRQKEKDFESDKEFQIIKEKLEDDKSNEKKKKKKKQSLSNWINYGSLNLYNGMGIKGELEIYFQEIEILKSKLDKLESTKKSLEDLLNKGLKNNLKCVVLREDDGFEMVLLKTTEKTREKFSFKSQFSVPAQKDEPLFVESAIK